MTALGKHRPFSGISRQAACIEVSLSVEHVAQLEWQQKSLWDIFASYAPFLTFSIYFKLKGQCVTSWSYSAGLEYSFLIFFWTVLAFWRDSPLKWWVQVSEWASMLAGSIWPVQLWERRHVLHPSPPLTGSYCLTAMSAARNVSPYICTKHGASAGNCRFMPDARPSAGPRHRHLVLSAVSRHDGDFCLLAEWVLEEGNVSKSSCTWTPSVSVAASAAAVPQRAPALGCASTGICRAVQEAGQQCAFSPHRLLSPVCYKASD